MSDRTPHRDAEDDRVRESVRPEGTDDSITGSLAKYMETVSPVLDVEARLPTRDELLRRGQVPIGQDSVCTVEGGIDGSIEVCREEIQDPDGSHVLRVGRETDRTTGKVLDDTHRIPLSTIGAIRQLVANAIPDVLRDFDQFRPDPDKLEKVHRTVADILRSNDPLPDAVVPTDMNIQAIVDELIYLGPISMLARDPLITDIMVHDYNRIFVESDGITYKVEGVGFQNPGHYSEFIDNLIARQNAQLNSVHPMLELHLKDGSRVHIAGPPCTVNGSYFLSIRRFRTHRFSLDELTQLKTMNEEMQLYLEDIEMASANVLTVGGTGAGKTTLLESLIGAKPIGESILTIEDTQELHLTHENCRGLVGRKSDMEGTEDISLRKLVYHALRMNPKSIIVGETRDETAYDILVAMNTGHTGCATTTHANSSSSGLRKFEMLAREAKERPPAEVLRDMIVECFDVVISVRKCPDGKRRVTSIDEVVKYDAEKESYVIRNVFRYVAVNRPNEPVRHKFLRNPGYFTTPKLRNKLEEANRPYTMPPDGTESEYADGLLVDQVVAEEQQHEQRLRDQALKERQERLQKYRDATQARERLRRKQQREEYRNSLVAERAALSAQAKEQRRLDKIDRKHKRKLERFADRERRKAETRAADARAKVSATLDEQQRKAWASVSRRHLDEDTMSYEAKTVRELTERGLDTAEAREQASVMAMAYRQEEERRIEDLSPWQKRNLEKAVELKSLVSGGKSVESIAEERGVSVNNVLKYLGIVDRDLVNTYRDMMRKKDRR